MAKLPANWKQKYLASKVLKQQQELKNSSISSLPSVSSLSSSTLVLPSNNTESSSFHTIRQQCQTKLCHTLLAYYRSLKNSPENKQDGATEDVLLVDSEVDRITKIATQIEKTLFEATLNDICYYKSAFRAHFLALRRSIRSNGSQSPSTKSVGEQSQSSSVTSCEKDFCHQLLTGRISPKVFGKMSTKDLRSYSLMQLDNTHIQENLRVKIVTPLPKTIQAYNDGRDREKWGVGKSAAAVDSDGE
ncbi:hypothetical protein NADFUDRAFT_50576 [Nadsonia fulvescens var. elongata DSM 6958]|uniref:Uncharacterized protein n=1 Tax=Nadsonia fulvescens var. elongata DSM 6958 TaxID=857566 RepID=A0A1E3PMJ6_9ASCO|nr:hypothetical protein NADFUDRAFT_50576 [Nadsonia fulvescens var. elongata DSM 6958]